MSFERIYDFLLKITPYLCNFSTLQQLYQFWFILINNKGNRSLFFRFFEACLSGLHLLRFFSFVSIRILTPRTWTSKEYVLVFQRGFEPGTSRVSRKRVTTAPQVHLVHIVWIYTYKYFTKSLLNVTLCDCQELQLRDISLIVSHLSVNYYLLKIYGYPIKWGHRSTIFFFMEWSDVRDCIAIRILLYNWKKKYCY